MLEITTRTAYRNFQAANRPIHAIAAPTVRRSTRRTTAIGGLDDASVGRLRFASKPIWNQTETFAANLTLDGATRRAEDRVLRTASTGGGRLVSTRWRMFGVLATTALVVTACSTGTGATSAPSAAAPSAAAPSTAASAAAALGGRAVRRPMPRRSTFDWWHITTGDPGKADFQAIADAYTAAHPNVKINITVLENEAFKTKLATQMQAGDVPDLFQSWGGAHHGPAGRRRRAQGHHRRRRVLGEHRQPGRHEHLPVQRQAVRHPVGHGHDRLLVQQGRCSSRPASRPRPPPGTTTSPPSASSRPRASPRSRSRARTSGRRCTCGPTSSSATAAATPSPRWSRPATGTPTPASRPAQDVVALNALNPYQDGYKGATYDNEAAAVGNGKAAMELMGQWAPVGPEGPERRQEGPRRRPRLVRLPGGRRRRGRAHRRRRRRQRHRGRQGRAARGDRLPEVLHERRQPEQAQHRRRRPLDHRRHREHRHRSRTCRPSSPVAATRSSCSSTSTRRPPGPWARPSTTRRWRCSPAPRRPRRCARRSPTPRPPSRSSLPSCSARRLTQGAGRPQPARSIPRRG